MPAYAFDLNAKEVDQVRQATRNGAIPAQRSAAPFFKPDPYDAPVGIPRGDDKRNLISERAALRRDLRAKKIISEATSRWRNRHVMRASAGNMLESEPRGCEELVREAGEKAVE
jgi:hypothetical protein